MGKAFSKDRVVKAGDYYVSLWSRSGGFGYTESIQMARRFTEHLARECVEDLERNHPKIEFKAVEVKQIWVEA